MKHGLGELIATVSRMRSGFLRSGSQGSPRLPWQPVSDRSTAAFATLRVSRRPIITSNLPLTNRNGHAQLERSMCMDQIRFDRLVPQKKNTEAHKLSMFMVIELAIHSTDASQEGTV